MHTPSAVAPSAAAHTSHKAVHAALQQRPSAQNPDAHSPPPPHASPCLTRHTPAALHIRVPAQLPGSSALVSTAQRPSVPASPHERHSPPHADSQQYPSTQ